MVVNRSGLQYQLHRDCGPEIAEGRKLSALRKAAAKGDAMMVSALLDAGGLNVDKPDPFHVLRHTALISAIEGKHAPVVELLLRHGASVANPSVFELARRRDTPEITGLLMAALPKPKSLDVAAVLDKPAGAPCPTEYVEMLSRCVHTYALARPTLAADVTAIVQGAASPKLRDWAQAEAPAAMKPVAAVFDDVALDFGDSTKLDPSALMRKGGPIKGRSASQNLPDIRKAPAARAAAKQNEILPGGNATSQDWKQWADKYTTAGGEFDEQKFKRELCAGYRPALARVRRGELPPGAAALGFTQASAAEAIEANIRACSQWGM